LSLEKLGKSPWDNKSFDSLLDTVKTEKNAHIQCTHTFMYLILGWTAMHSRQSIKLYDQLFVTRGPPLVCLSVM